MRDELTNLSEKDYWRYGPRISQFEETYEQIKYFARNLKDNLNRNLEDAKEEYPEEDIFCEIQADLLHEAFMNEHLLWQFCLLRLQGIFEALIENEYSRKNSRSKFGIKSKISVLKKAGFTISDTEELELFRWAKLRNSLSHAPPDTWDYLPLNESDILEYKNLVTKISLNWDKESRGQQA